MAIYHCSISNVSRAKGASSCATYAYISGEKIYDDRLNKTFNYSHKERVLKTVTILPKNAPAEYADPKKMFNSIEKKLTADNARTAKKIEVALPKELSLEEQQQILNEYIYNNLTKEGYAAIYSIHEDIKKTGNRHAHIEIPNRPINERGEWCGKSKKDYVLDDNGNRIPIIEYQKDENRKYLKDKNGRKIPILDENGQPKQKVDNRNRKQWKRIDVEVNKLDTKEFLFQLRKEWANEVNKHLPIEQQIDHRSHNERGLEKIPTIHEGYAARRIEERGKVSDRCQYNRNVKVINDELKLIKAELAANIEQDNILKRKEHEIHERLRNVGRRDNDYEIRRTRTGKQQIENTADSGRTVAPVFSATRERELEAKSRKYEFEKTEREIARIIQEREAAKRAKSAITAEKQRIKAEPAKCKQSTQKSAKSTRKSHENKFTR